MIRQAVVTVVCLMLVAGVGCSEMTLVSEGQAVATIVTADRPSGAARDGARMLQDYLRRISGAELAVVGASRAPDGARILVGSSPLTEAHGYVDDELALEQAIVRVHGDDLVVIGDDATPEGRALMGTRHAAVMLLREIGVRWLWPGELGTVTPEAGHHHACR
jgi:hypothetical protein